MTASWLKGLAGSTSITEMTLPGTHDSCACRPLPYGRCQTLTLPQQLERGVRFLDIRCRHRQNTFAMHHGLYNLKLDFDDVLDACAAFLHTNPSEFILFSVNEEYKPLANTRPFEETLLAYIKKRPGLFYTERRFPLLEQVRGKLVLFSRYGGNSLGIDASDWGTACKTNAKTSIIVQDNYMLRFPKNHKWADVKPLLERAARTPGDGQLYLNFASGTGVLRPDMPRAVAKRTNARILAHCKALGKARLGVLILDFPEQTPGLLEQLIHTNF